MALAKYTRFSCAALLALGIVSAPFVSYAQISAVPSSMNIQGRLASSSGNPLPDGTYTVRFSLWDAASGGTEKYNKTVSTLALKNGVFATVLNAFPAGTFNGNLWLEIKVGNDAPQTPRVPLAAVPYAVKSDLALTVPDSSITAAKIADGTLTANKFAAGVLGGSGWSLTGNSGTDPATNFLGTTDNQPLVFKVNNRRALRLDYASTSTVYSINVRGGSEANVIDAGVLAGTVAGGGYIASNGQQYPNRVGANYGTIGGGYNNTVSGIGGTVPGGYGNTASGQYSVVAGGETNQASGDFAAVSGGSSNLASGAHSVVLGGRNNTASGQYSVVAGGEQNTASGTNSFAAGLRAKANHAGTFIWGDFNNSDFASTGTNQFLIRSSGGVGINTNAPSGVLTLQGTTANARIQFGGNGVDVHQMSSGRDLVFNATGGQFTFRSITDLNNLTSPTNQLSIAPTGNATLRGTLAQNSDARYKKNIATLDNALDLILGLRGVSYQWNETDRGDGRQIGFIAQELEKVLPELVSTDERGYKSVAYANVVPVFVEAVKTLKQDYDATKKENAELKARLEAIEHALSELKANR